MIRQQCWLGNHHQAGWVVKVRSVRHKIKFSSINLCHGLVIGSTGSGKTQKVVLPNILFNITSTIRPSMVITDPKGAVLKVTTPYLQQCGYRILILDFECFSGVKWNPLIPIHKLWASECYDLAEQQLILYVDAVFPTPSTTADPFWHQTAKKLIRGVIMGLMIESCANKVSPSIILPRQIHAKIAQPRLALIEWFTILIKTSSRLKLCLGALIYENEKTLSSIINQADSELSRLSFGLFNRMAVGHEIDFHQLRDEPTVIFIKTNTVQNSFHFLAQLFIENLNVFLLQPDQLQHPRPLLLLLDEFGSIPKIKYFSEVLANAREYNFWYLLIVQYYGQLNRYPDQAGIAANTDLKFYLGTSDIKTTKVLTEEYGQQLVRGRQSNSHSQLIWPSKEWLIDNYALTKLDSNQMIIKLKATDPCLVNSSPFWSFKSDLNLFDSNN